MTGILKKFHFEAGHKMLKEIHMESGPMLLEDYQTLVQRKIEMPHWYPDHQEAQSSTRPQVC